METLRSPNLLGSFGRPLGTERSPLHPSSAERASDLFEDEMERAVERDGGREMEEQRLSSFRQAHRDERHAGFERYHEHDRGPQSPRSEATPAATSTPGATDQPLSQQPALSPPTTPSQVGAGGAPLPGPTTPPTPVVGSAPAPSASAPPPPSASVLASPPGLAAGVAMSPTVPAGAPAGPAPGADPSAGAILGGAERARTASASASAPTRPAEPPAPDPALVEQAAEVLRQLRAHLAPGAQRILVHLSPPELGRIAIEMAQKKGRITALVRAESPETLELLQRQAPELRAMLATEGIDAERFELQLGTHGDFHGERQTPALTPPHVAARGIHAPEPDPPDGTTRTTPRAAEGIIDTYA